MTETLGEIIQTSTREMMGQVWKAQTSPAFGSLVMSKLQATAFESHAVGVVYNVQTTGADLNRLPQALGLPETEILQKHPQLPHILRSYFQAYWVGTYREVHLKGKREFRFQTGLPQIPPPLHAGIRACLDDEIRLISNDVSLFRLIYDGAKGAAEELLLQVCSEMAEAHGWKTPEVVRIGKGLSALYRDDYDTLRRILFRLEQWT